MTISEYLKYAELAQAAYANIAPGTIGDVGREELQGNANMTPTQAQDFADNWTVIDQYNHSELYDITDEFGQPTGEYGSYSNGLSVTLFQDNSGNQVIAVRGTDDLSDWGSNFIDIGLLGTDKYQGQYAALAAQVEQWRHDEVLRSGYSVTGHSLGGFLATHLALDYAAEIEHTYIYNAPGVTGVVSGNLFAGIVNALSPGKPMTFPDDVPISNIVSTSDLVSSVGLSIAPPITIDIESNLNPIHNHSIVTLTDSLAVYNLFATIDPSVNIEAISAILQASSATANTTLESAVSGLGQLLVEGFVPRTGNHYDSDREALYADLKSITTALGETSGMTVVPLGFTDTNGIFTTLLPYEIESRARTDIAYRYALVILNPYAVIGADYSRFNQNGELDLYDSATGQGLTNMYLADRAEMLALLIHSNISDITLIDGNVQYEAKQEGVTLRAINAAQTVAFNGDEGGILEGINTSSGNRLYGGSGNDVLRGGMGDDYLEGGAGADILDGGKGNDILNGGAGHDVYIFRPDHGHDTIVDFREEDGFQHGTIQYIDGSDIAIAAGNFTPDESTPNTWHSSQGHFTLTKDAGLWTLTTPGGTIDLGGGFVSGDFGIMLEEAVVEQGPIYTSEQENGSYIRATQPGTIQGTNGDDMLIGNSEGGTIYGGGGSNWIYGNGGTSTIYGGDGGSLITGFGGGSTVYGGAGDDIIAANGGEYFFVNSPNPLVGADAFWRDFNNLWEKGHTPMPSFEVFATEQEDTLINWWAGVKEGTYAGASVLGDGWTYSFTLAGGNFYARYYHPEMTPDGSISPATSWRRERHLVHFTEGVTLYAGGGNNLLIGNAGDDYLFGGDGNDILLGGAGNDILVAGSGNNLLNGGPGDDILIGGTGNDKLEGGDGDDIIFAVSGNNLVSGGAGNDILYGGDGDDHLWGDDGDDIIFAGSGDNYLDGGAGNDILYGGDGNDRLHGGAGDDILFAGSGNNYLYGGSGNNILYGGDGDDHLWGGDGDDIIFAGSGNNYLDGGGGNNILYGGDGDDVLYGGDGNDLLVGGGGIDYLNGGYGDDIYMINAGDAPLRGDLIETIEDPGGNDTLRFGPGISVEDLKLYRGSGRNLYISFGHDLLRIVDGWDGIIENYEFADGRRLSFEQLIGAENVAELNDPDALASDPDTTNNSGLVVRIVPFEGEEEDGSLVFGDESQSDYIIIPGYGVVDLAQYDVQVYVDGVRVSGWQPGSLTGATIYGPDGTLFQSGATSGGGDVPVSGTLNGTEEDNILIGDESNNKLYGEGGNNLLIANAGNNQLYGGTGDNIFVAGSGNDRMYSNTATSNDIYRFGRSSGTNFINDRGGSDVLALGEGIGEEHVALRRIGADLELRLDTGESVTIQNMFNASTGALNESHAIEIIRFSDGTEWDIDRMRVEAVQGTDDDDVIYGFDTDDVLIGGAGNDRLYGVGGNNTLIGVSGDNQMYGGTGDNIFVAGSGNDLMVSQHADSNDIYRFGRGDGHNVIRDFGGTDRIELSEGIDPSQLTLRRGQATTPIPGGLRHITTLVLTLDTGETLTVESMLDYPDNYNEHRNIETIRFADGTEWDIDRIRFEALKGTDGDDVIYGFETDDVLSGGAGNDYLSSFWGNNTFIAGSGNNVMDGGAGNNLFITGSGHDVIHSGTGDSIFVMGTGTGTIYSYDNSNDVYRFGRGSGEYQIFDKGGIDRIELGEGIAPADVILRRNDYDLHVQLDTGERIIVKDMFDFTGTIKHSSFFNKAIETIRFADGTEWDIEAIRSELVRGTSGDDVIQGIAGGSEYRLEPGSGNDIVLPVVANDQVALGVGVTPEQVSLRMVRGDLVILLDSGDSLTVSGMFDRSTGILNEAGAIEMIRFADGTQWDIDAIRDRAPSDYLVFNDGQQTINNHVEGLNTLHFGNGVNYSDVAMQLTRFQNDLILKAGTTGNQITLRNFFLGGPYMVELISFSDGLQLTAEQIFGAFGLDIPPDPVIEPENPAEEDGDSGADPGDDDNPVENSAGTTFTNGNDVILGGVTDNLLYGGAGNDLLVGGGGTNNYYYSSGQDVIDNRAGGAATLTFKEGITFSQVASGLVKSGDDLILRVDGGPDQVKILNFFQGGVYQLQSLHFESGGSIAGEQIFGAFGIPVPENGPGPDNGDNTADGGGDVFVFTAGDGEQIIDNSLHVRDTLNFVGISFNQIASRLMKMGNDLILSVADTSDRVTIRNWFLGGDNPVLTISFASGGQISADQIFGAFGLSNPDPERTPRYTDLPDLADFDTVYKNSTSDSRAIFGSSGSDFIQGGAGNDVLRGGAGDDYLIGGAGNDTYLFGVGDGNDTINNYDPSGFDRILFDTDVAIDSIAFFRNGNHLEIGYGTDDRITVSNHFISAHYSIDQIQLANGSYLTDADINQIIQDVAGYAVTEGIALGSINDVRQHNDLMTMVANSWQAAA